MRQMQLSEQQFDGATYDAKRDGKRLRSQLERVKAALSDGQWWSVSDLVRVAGGSDSSITARARDLRKAKNGSHIVQSKNMGRGGSWFYRMVL